MTQEMKATLGLTHPQQGQRVGDRSVPFWAEASGAQEAEQARGRGP